MEFIYVVHAYSDDKQAINIERPKDDMSRKIGRTNPVNLMRTHIIMARATENIREIYSPRGHYHLEEQLIATILFLLKVVQRIKTVATISHYYVAPQGKAHVMSFLLGIVMWSRKLISSCLRK